MTDIIRKGAQHMQRFRVDPGRVLWAINLGYPVIINNTEFEVVGGNELRIKGREKPLSVEEFVGYLSKITYEHYQSILEFAEEPPVLLDLKLIDVEHPVVIEEHDPNIIDI